MAGVDFDFSLHDEASGNLAKIGGGIDDVLAGLRDLNTASGKGAGGLEKGMTGAVAAGGVLAGVLLKVGDLALSAAAALASMAIKGAVALGEAAIQAAAFSEKAILAIEQLTHGTANGAKELADVTKLAADLGLPVQATIKQYQKLLAMQFKPAMAKQMIAMVGDLQAIGAGAEETSRVLMSLSQIKAKGKLQGEELLQLAEAGISTELVIEALGKQLGKTSDEVRKLMQAGKITADQGLAAIGEAVKKKTGIKEFGEAGKKFADTTLAGFAAKMKSKGEALMLEVGQRILGPLKEALAPIAKDIFAAMESDDFKMIMTGVVDAIVFTAKAVGTLWGMVKAAWPTVRAFISGFADGGGAWAAFSAILSGVGSALKPIIEALGGSGDSVAMARLLGQALGLMAVAAITVVGAIAAVVLAITAIPIAVMAAVAWLTNLAISIGAAGFEIIAKAVEIGSGIISGIVSGITNGLSSVVQAIKNVASTAISTAKSALGIGSPSKLFEDQAGVWIPEGLAKGVNKNAGVVNSAIDGMVTPPSSPTVGLSSGSGGGRSITLTVHTTVQMNGGGGKDSPTAQQIADANNRTVGATLERFAVEAGL